MFLVQRGVLLPEQNDFVYGDQGHPPGPNAAEAFDGDWPLINELAMNGVEVTIGRQFTEIVMSAVRCPHCRRRFYPMPNAVDDAMTRWLECGETRDAVCPACGRVADLNDWFDPPWGYGELTLTFWNWPPLRDGFVASVAEVLGHRVRVISGKL